MKQLIKSMMALGLGMLALGSVGCACCGACDNSDSEKVSALIKGVEFFDDFENGAGNWEFKDGVCWKGENVEGGNGVLHLFKKKSPYKPPFRSPLHMALLKENSVGSFTLDVKLKSTHKDYGHRDLCLFFNYQNPSQFYYVHLGKKADNHANQIFIVNKAPRKKISITSTKGTNWDDQWHNVRIKRDVETGTIEIYFDDMTKPAMTAKDDTFKWGRIGLGSFDDIGYFDDVKLVGDKAAK